ncbi:GYLTL1B [Bugula neritina]|uniref:GYLTL1B n=1 Tax=Bugula neritina TaxID=10212 RepID=A0A7J7K5M2_BUGNE|nr:GYLTL1B [Bugula neritina]
MRCYVNRFTLLLVIAVVPVLLLYYIASTTTPSLQLVGGDFDGLEDIVQQLNDAQSDNHRLRTQLGGLQAKLGEHNFSKTVPQCEIIHICIVCAGYDASRHVTTVIKSILFYRHNTLHLHLVVDSISLPILNTLLESWEIPSVLYSFYSTSTIQQDVSWIPNAHYSGVYGLMKLQMPYVLLLDTDVLFSADVAELWSMFDLFSADQYLGLVENLSDWYLHSSGLTAWPAVGRGFNTGVMLMQLRVMREKNWAKLWRHTANKYLPEAGPTKLADQDIINAVIKDNVRIVHTLPCNWNIQVTYRSTFEPTCYSTANVKVVHFNSPAKYQVYFGDSTKDAVSDYFKNIYFMFLQYDGNLLKHKSLAAKCHHQRSGNSTTHPTIVILLDSVCQCYMPSVDWSSLPSYTVLHAISCYTVLQADLLEKSVELSSACYHVEGIRQSSRGRLHLYYLKYNSSVDTESGDITLVAQLSIDRLGVLELLCEHWTGPMSLALYLSDAEAQQFHDFVSNSPSISHRQNIGYHVVFKTGTHYPVNYLRNIALNNARTQFIFLTDIDFLPMVNMYSYLREAANSYDIHNRKLALVVPAFETQQYRPAMPYDKVELKKYVDTGQIQIFRYDVWPAGHRPTNYSRWFNSSQPYEVSWEPNYEPYIVVSRELVPKYDERFFGFGWNKVSHIMEVDAQGFKMVVVPNAFIVHSPHAPSLDISQYRTSQVYRTCLKTLKKEFQKDLSRRYGIRALKYLSND